jgi:hypothetical protein
MIMPFCPSLIFMGKVEAYPNEIPDGKRVNVQNFIQNNFKDYLFLCDGGGEKGCCKVINNF